MWGCFSSKGIGRLKLVEGSIDSKKYVSILEECMPESLMMCELDKENLIFQQDNAPCHTSKFTKAWFKEQNMKVMSWPANSADLNPIENLWMILKHKLHGKGINNKRLLVIKTIDAWMEFQNDEILKKLVKSMPKRVEAVIKSKGGPIDY